MSKQTTNEGKRDDECNNARIWKLRLDEKEMQMPLCPTAKPTLSQKNVFRPMREKRRLEKERSKLCIGRIHPLIRYSFSNFLFFRIGRKTFFCDKVGLAVGHNGICISFSSKRSFQSIALLHSSSLFSFIGRCFLTPSSQLLIIRLWRVWILVISLV